MYTVSIGVKLFQTQLGPIEIEPKFYAVSHERQNNIITQGAPPLDRNSTYSTWDRA